MIRSVADLTDVDRQLAGLGAAPQNVAALIERNVGGKLGLAEVDAALADLSAGIASQPQARSERPAPFPRSDDTMPDIPLSEAWKDSERPPASSRPPATSWGAPPSLHPPKEEPIPVQSRDRSFESLLDQDLDPNEFPRTRTPAPQESPVKQEAEAESEDDGFEMLIEDEELLEVDDDE